MPRVCERCGEPLIQRANEKPGRFAARRFCSRRCSSHNGSEAARKLKLSRQPPTHEIERNGYLLRWVRDAKPMSSRHRSGNYRYVHRLVMEEHLGRSLAPGETVHHINHDRLDNRIENLRLYSSNSEHRSDEERERRGPKPICPSCGQAARRGRTYCSRQCAVEGIGRGEWKPGPSGWATKL